MISVVLPVADAPSAAEAVSDYFATEAHYLSLAGRIVAALRGAGNFVLVTGDPPASMPLLSEAIGKATASRLTVISTELTHDEVLRALSVVAPIPASAGASAVPDPSQRASPLLVFDDADRLSDAQIKDIYEAMRRGGGKDTVGVLLARPSFLARLEEPAVRFLKEGLAAQFSLHDIGPDEAIDFLRYQLENRQRHLEARDAPRSVWRGLAIVVILAMAGIVVFLSLHPINKVGEPSADTATGISSTRPSSMPSEATSTVLPNAEPGAEPEAASPGALQPLPAPPAVSSPSLDFPTGRELSPPEIAALVTRGDGFLGAGDIASARLFYERAADAGDGAAALRLGATFDPGFLGRIGVRGIPGDSDRASSWYRRARELGAGGEQLKSLEQRPSAEPGARAR